MFIDEGKRGRCSLPQVNCFSIGKAYRALSRFYRIKVRELAHTWPCLSEFFDPDIHDLHIHNAALFVAIDNDCVLHVGIHAFPSADAKRQYPRLFIVSNFNHILTVFPDL